MRFRCEKTWSLILALGTPLGATRRQLLVPQVGLQK